MASGRVPKITDTLGRLRFPVVPAADMRAPRYEALSGRERNFCRGWNASHGSNTDETRMEWEPRMEHRSNTDWS